MASIGHLEKNLSKSFKHVKKDMVMLNDAFADLHEKIQHLSLNHATLLGEVERLRSEVSGKSKKKVSSKSKKA